MTNEQTREALVTALMTNAYLNMCESDDMKNAISAIDKQIPKKIEKWNGQCACPTCNKLFGNLSQLKNLIHWEMPYCKFCGQAIGWSDVK